jgi:hypothetical protein
VPPYTIAAGNPARVIQHRIAPELAALVDETEWWNLEIAQQDVLSELALVDFDEDPGRAKELLVELLVKRDLPPPA